MVVPQRPRVLFRVAVLVLVLATLVAACGGSPANPSPATATASIGPSRAGDLAFLLERLEAIHPDPWASGDRDAVVGRLERLAGRGDALSDDEFLVEVMRLLGSRDRDGHTGLFPFAQAESGLEGWPLALYEFEEGLYVVDARKPYADAVGSRVVEIGGRPVEEVRDAVRPLVSRDNEWTVRARSPGYVVVPQVLRG
ncbi:MAG TPA: hypothetical protein VFR46_04830, partial [Actinomycetes bacterium]|nr:hypothetical protein [Actinomycetes bacterium]